jgi:hypothetical protein
MKFVHLMQQILWMSFYLLTNAIIFVRLLPDQNSFVPVDMPFDGRKPVAAQFKRHRLLQFTRAVSFPVPVELPQFASGAGKELHHLCDRRS